MIFENHDIIVGRDKAHVRELLAIYPKKEVISASDFFLKLHVLAFLYDPKLKRDDDELLHIAINILLSQKKFPCFYAKNFISLYSSFLHGLCEPKSLAHLLDEKKDKDLKEILDILISIEKHAAFNKITNQVGVLFLVNKILQNDKSIHPYFLKKNKIVFYYLVDMTLLEIEIIKSLSKLGIRFDLIFPQDFLHRNINVSIEYTIKELEKDDNLNNINIHFNYINDNSKIKKLSENIFLEDSYLEFDSNTVNITSHSNILKEAVYVAQRIALKKSQDKNAKIALVVRNIDTRSMLFKRAVERFGIFIKDRKGMNLKDSKAHRLLKSLFIARIYGLRKIDLLALLNNEFFIYVSEEFLEKLIILINELCLDDGLYKNLKPWQRHLYKIERYEKNDLSEKLITIIKNIVDLIYILPDQDSFLGFNEKLNLLIEKAFIKKDLEDESLNLLKKTCQFNISSKSIGEKTLFLRDFISIIEAQIEKVTLSSGDFIDKNAVEFLLLPELLGRNFDHVFIVDICFSRLPQNVSDDPICNDDLRLKFNQIAKKPILKLFFDDPFEPLLVPPRQALEPFWFSCAILALKSVEFSCALADENGEVESPSEFFLWLSKHVKINQIKETKFISKEDETFFKAKSLDLLFYKKDFIFEKKQILKLCAGRLDDDPKKALTPTFIEKFANCPFYGLMDEIFLSSSLSQNNEDISNKILGTIAHQALHDYFAIKEKSIDILVEDLSLKYIKQNYLPDLDIFNIYIEWLKLSLKELINSCSDLFLKSNNLVTEKYLIDNKKITINNNSFLLGGIIDRIDKIGDEYLVIDYKLSSEDYLKNIMSESNWLKNNFQLPIYWRLVANNFSPQNPFKIKIILISIKDRKILQANLKEKNFLKEKIFDENSKDGLFEKINDIFHPIKNGIIKAYKNNKCDECYYAHICRIKES